MLPPSIAALIRTLFLVVCLLSLILAMVESWRRQPANATWVLRWMTTGLFFLSCFLALANA